MNKEELEKLKKLAGKARGVTFKTDASYVLKKMGEDGLAKLQQKTKELGWEIDYKEIKTMAWYPLVLRVISLIAVKEAFGWGDKEIEDMGNSAPKYSFIAGTMLKYFLSVKRVFQETSKYWEKHYTIGVLEPLEIDEKKKYGILELREFKIHPILCLYFCGYFLRISQYVIESKKITIEETDCMFRGASSHKFLIKWA